MKHLKPSLAATALALIFTISASAGEILCGVTSQPPSQLQSSTNEMSAGISTINETSSSDSPAVDPVMEIALNLLQSVISLF